MQGARCPRSRSTFAPLRGHRIELLRVTTQISEVIFMFNLHPQLERDTLPIADLPLCHAVLMNNALFPWLILVPRVPEAREIIDLEAAQRHLLMDEIARVSQAMRGLFRPDKLNVAALGNQVPQLHVHVIARFTETRRGPIRSGARGWKLTQTRSR